MSGEKQACHSERSEESESNGILRHTAQDDARSPSGAGEGLSGAEIYAAYREKVFAYLTARTERREDAEDLCGDVFAKVLKGLDRYDPKKASISTWIYQITRFTYIDHLRKKRPEEPLCEEIAEADDIEEALINKDTLKRLAFALQALKREERDIVVLRYYKGLSLTEISRLTGISYGMVKVRHVSALAALRDLLGSGEQSGASGEQRK